MSGGGGGLNDPSISSAPESLLVGRTLLVADNITNSVVAQGPPSALEIIERLLDQIDVKPDQVMISTVIGQLSLKDTHDTGVSYLINSGDFLSGVGGGFPAFLSADSATATNTFPEFKKSTLTDSGLRAYGKAGDLGIFVKALQERSDFTVLSRPSIFTSNNQKGTISSGERIPIPTGTNNSGNYSSTQIQYQDVVLKLEVIPLVNSNKEITMQIFLVNDDSSSTIPIQGVGEVPVVNTQELVTTATVPNNQTIVLGGLISNSDNTVKSGIPILSDIPYLGRLFSSNTDNKRRKELMVFIQPSIVNNERSLDDVQGGMDNRYKVSGKTRNFADGPGVLPTVDEIPRVETSGKNGAAPKAQAVDSSPRKAVKKTQPVFRR